MAQQPILPCAEARLVQEFLLGFDIYGPFLVSASELAIGNASAARELEAKEDIIP